MSHSYITELRKKIGKTCIHAPGVRAIILNDMGEVLLQRRTDMDCWGLPAGAVELGESAIDELRREVYEETAITVNTAEPMALYSGPGQRFQYPNGDWVQGFAITFIIRDWTGQMKPDGIEGSELRFWPVRGLPPDIVPIHLQTIQDYEKYQGQFIVSHNQITGEYQS